jgi:hypothetical protein
MTPYIAARGGWPTPGLQPPLRLGPDQSGACLQRVAIAAAMMSPATMR